MTKTYTIILLFFFLASGLMFGKITGTWKQMFPEKNGEVPGPRYDHYMCPIGNQKVIMIGGKGGGNPNYYANETWIYDYPTNTWTRMMSDKTPDTYMATAFRYDFFCKISEKRVIWCDDIRYIWLFDIDSLKWFNIETKFNTSSTSNLFFLEENVIFNYINYLGWGISELWRMHPEEPFDSPNFITTEIINDEKITKQGPFYHHKYFLDDPGTEKYFMFTNERKSIAWVPVGDFYGQLYPWDSSMSMEKDVWNWLFLLQNPSDTIPRGDKRRYSELANNALLVNRSGIYDDKTDFYTVEYYPETNQLHTFKIPGPGNGVWNCKMAKIKDGTVLLFGGMLVGSTSGQTWVFEMDPTDGIIDNAGQQVRIFELGDNIYQLDEDIKNAALYNMLGQQVFKCQDDMLNINHLPFGVYLLQYEEKGISKSAKVVKR